MPKNPVHTRSPNGFQLHWPAVTGGSEGTRCSRTLVANCASEIHSLTCLRCLKALWRENPTDEIARRIGELTAEKKVGIP